MLDTDLNEITYSTQIYSGYPVSDNEMCRLNSRYFVHKYVMGTALLFIRKEGLFKIVSNTGGGSTRSW